MSQYELCKKLDIPSKEEMNTAYPQTFCEKRIKEKGLSNTGDFSDKYLYMQALYKANLEFYLLSVLDLKETDQELADSEWNIYPIEESKNDIYAKYSTMNLEYFYLRNNTQIEYLSGDDLSQLEEHLKTGTEIIDAVMQEMVIRTYPIVIKARIDGDDDEYLTGYGDGTHDIPNTAVVIVLGSSSLYDQNGNKIDSDTRQERNQFIERIIKEKEAKYKTILNHDIYIWNIKEVRNIKI